MPTSVGTLSCVVILSCGAHLDPPLSDAGRDSGTSGASPTGNGVGPPPGANPGPSTGSNPTTGGTSTGETLPPGPGRVLYTQCNALGALDCSLADPKIRLLCDGMNWTPIGVCTGQQVCDNSPGPNQGLCAGPAPIDSGGAVSVGDAAGASVVLYAQCSTLGALQCSLKDPKIQVLCDGMTWRPIGVCTGQQVCDPFPGPNQGLCENP